MTEVPNLRWFDTFSRCRKCDKRAHGILRGSRNESYGTYCTKCAEKRLRDSKKIRELEEKEANASTTL